MPIYRALRDVEIAAGNILIPKDMAPFVAHPRLPIKLPFTLGETTKHAIRDHQLHGKYPTRGISCTSDWSIAEYYAQKNRVIATVDEKLCAELGIRAYCVCDNIDYSLIENPRDKEIILVADFDGPFPIDIILEITKL
jgi:hypothetical protein